ncbi:methionyl-tRNA formyltransferase [Chloropicon primus]|uniref:methionyl-tRNA formyltransferase n=2 Tax=Chloropicon primus TaxID=1764295 RepID=A0A5B8N1G8_9CHLO|nr:methionyl-tRNA formyltransferase [Chloropicon primus]UPR04876.1 methionyl-tRNA formyltransferase [Chloropicon primus]|eukprot:QDZ25680.1 methionyl-tRNA formyltransferase [Chloropicon primus]
MAATTLRRLAGTQVAKSQVKGESRGVISCLRGLRLHQGLRKSSPLSFGRKTAAGNALLCSCDAGEPRGVMDSASFTMGIRGEVHGLRDGGSGAREQSHHWGASSRHPLRCYGVGRAGEGGNSPRRVVFLGTPEAAAVVLRDLMAAAEESKGGKDAFEVSAVVTRPSKRKTHGKVMEGSPVASVASELGLGEHAILSPQSAKDESFLEAMRDIGPDLCVTAAYGNLLPPNFLDIPTFGTVNIHPSELPCLRGPAPVQRAILRGDRRLCVSLAFTVFRMDAGKIIGQKWLSIGSNETSDVALSRLFSIGSEMLVESMPELLSGRAQETATEQDETRVTHAPKLSKEEGVLQPHVMTAKECHDVCCALNIWPGTSVNCNCVTPVKKGGKGGSQAEEGRKREFKEDNFVMKVSGTSVEESLDEWDAENMPLVPGNMQMYRGKKSKDMLLVCHGNTLLRVGSVQLPGKKPMQPRAFFNGRKGATLKAKEEEKLEVEFNPDILAKIAKADTGRGINLN